MTAIFPKSRKSIAINFSRLIPTIEEDIVRKTAYKFNVKQDTQNIYIELSNLNADYDLYLSPEEGVNHSDQGHIEINSIYANSTQFGTNREIIFAQLPEGSYYLKIKQNRYSQETIDSQKPTGTLTFNSNIFRLPRSLALSSLFRVYRLDQNYVLK